MNIGIVGCGLIGNRRAQVAQEAGDNIIVVADIDPARARSTGEMVQATWVEDWQVVTRHPEIEAVVVATVNKTLLPVTIDALKNGKHVLCEKPLGRNAQEAGEMVQAAAAAQRVLKVGFNHRHHPAIWQAHELAQAGKIGPLMSIRAAYGHGGRPGYDQEWRGNPDLAGGGELLDQGVHIVDLCRWFLGDFSQVSGMLGTWFWKVAPLEDNGFALLRTAKGQIASSAHQLDPMEESLSLRSFWAEWIFNWWKGWEAVMALSVLTMGLRRPESGPPILESWEYPGPDISWAGGMATNLPAPSGKTGPRLAKAMTAIRRR